MLQPEDVIKDLRESASLWEAGPGLVGLRGSIAELMRDIERQLGGLARLATGGGWRTPAGGSCGTRRRAGAFASFPQWLSTASHLSGDESVLHGIAASDAPAREARNAVCRAETVLPPAVCYNTYAALAGSVVDAPVIMTAQGTCWRHEGDRLSAL